MSSFGCAIFSAAVFEDFAAIVSAKLPVFLFVVVLFGFLLLRTILVPAAMHLLGERNWWLPAWLDRLLPHLSVDESVEPSDVGNSISVM